MRRTAASSTRRQGLDADAVRQYFAGIEALAREARTSQDPRVLKTALAVLERQHATVRTFLRRAAK